MTHSNDDRSVLAWPQEKIATLTRLYVDEGLTHAQIGHRMGITKNQAIGKRTRLGLVRRSGFVPTAQQAGRLRQEELRGPASTIHSRLGALHATMDALLARKRPATIAPVKGADNATLPVWR